ncbi:MAG: type III pantothenate kinase [Bacteroidota bacterium]
MNLVIDIGNTLAKVAVFKENTLILKENTDKENLLEVLGENLKKYSISNAIFSSVGKIDDKDFAKIKQLCNLIVLNNSTKVPFKNFYSTPKTLGVDRIALVSGAASKFPKTNVLIIDAGSCITYDFVNSKSEYYGGAISPGIEMRYRSVHEFTANLPKLSKTEIPSVGNSTENAIHLGVLNGVFLEMEGIIEQYKQENRDLTIILTGGDTNFLAKNIKSSIFANSNFLLEGLNSILMYNLEE